jgi:glycosyltransferase involved in cell wall biosynthesis
VPPHLNSYGGAERVILEIAKKFNPKIYATEYEKDKTFPDFGEFDIKVIRPSILSRPTRVFLRMERDIRVRTIVHSGFALLNHKIRENYDVLNAHLTPGNWIRNRNERVCWFCHGPTPSFDTSRLMLNMTSKDASVVERMVRKTGYPVYRAIELPIVKKIEKICTCSNNTKQKIAKYLGRDDAQIIHPGLNPEDFSCTEYGKFFLYVSRIVPEKRIEFAINAFKKFNKGRGWKLVIAGFLSRNPRNVEYLATLRSIADANIAFETALDEKRLKFLLSGCYAMLFSPMDEDWGIVVIEAMASLKPVISANVGGPRESIVNGKTGFLVNSPDEMAQKMHYLADHPDECERMGRAGRRRVEQNYTWKIFLDRMEKAYKETAKM